jgi:hypothetical protein
MAAIVHSIFGWLFNDDVSINDGMTIRESGAVDEMKIDRNTEVPGESPPQYHCDHYKSQMTWSMNEPKGGACTNIKIGRQRKKNLQDSGRK